MVAAAQGLADLGEGGAGLGAQQVHGHLARQGHLARAVAAQQTLERDAIGEIKTISILEHRIPFLDKVNQWNKFSKYSGGTLVEKCCHYFDLMNLFAQSRPVSVFASGSMAVNFIEFEGTGRVHGIRGNKASYPVVYFFGRAEDRNEPGSTGANEGQLVDRYFMNVFTDPADPVGSSIMLVDLDGNPATVDPVLITEGNMQLHSTGCDEEEIEAVALASSLATFQAAVAVPAAVEFAAPRPNPAASHATLRFALPREARVSLSVFDVGGRLVRELAAGTAGPGAHTVTWNLLDRDGQRVSNGVFFARLAVDGQLHTQAMVVAR